MKAMVLAAGFGTRLGTLGATTPKCLIDVNGKTLLERVLNHLQQAGVKYIVINLHHLADQVKDYLKSHKFPALDIHLSHEVHILGTGGGVKFAEKHFSDSEDFLIHNADVYSELDLRDLISMHQDTRALATLAMRAGGLDRALLFDQDGKLSGWVGEDGTTMVPGAGTKIKAMEFAGIQVVSRRIFDYLRGEEGKFSIITAYINAAERGESVRSFDMLNSYWLDAGTPKSLERLRAYLKSIES